MNSDGRPHDHAEAHARRAVPTAGADDLAAAVLRSFVGRRFDAADFLVLLGDRDRFLGVVRPERLLAAADATRVGDLVEPQAPVAAPDCDQEAVALMAIRHGLAAVPVVRADGTFVGIVPAQSLLEILRREHVEDMHLLAGCRSDCSARALARLLRSRPLRSSQVESARSCRAAAVLISPAGISRSCPPRQC